MKFLVFILFLLSCHRASMPDPLQTFSDEIYYYISKAQHIDFHEIKKFPKGLWSPVLRVDRFCLLYLEADDQNLGLLKWIEVSPLVRCLEKTTSSSAWELKRVSQFFIEKEKDHLKIKLSYLGRRVQEWEMNIPLINLRDNGYQEGWKIKNLSSQELFKSYALPGSVSGFWVEPSFKDKKVLQDGDLCHNVDETCKNTQAYLCHLCPNGWYEVQGGGCVFSSKKYCGTPLCGQEGQVACDGGLLEEPLAFTCKGQARKGLCSEADVAVCLKNGEVWCR